MPKYIDCLAIPVPKRNLAYYRRVTPLLGRIWKDHGALRWVDCVADDVQVGKLTSFPRALKLRKDEVVVLEYIEYRSRRDRDRILKTVLTDPRMKRFMDRTKIPFDGKRVIKGGFKCVVDAE